MQNMRVFSLQTCCKSFYMSYLYRFRNPSFHCVQCHSKDFRLLHCLLLCKVRGKHFLLYLYSQNGSQAATLIKTFIKSDLRFSLQYIKEHLSSFYPSPSRGVRRDLVSRWAVKPACLVYIPIRGEGVYLKRFLILFFKLPLALRAAAMRAAASLPALVRWSRWPS